MAESLIDCRFEALRELGFQGSVNDMLFEYWEALGGIGNTLNDRWVSFLEDRGFFGQLNDSWYSYLGSLGFEGHINDREFLYWCGIRDSLLLGGLIVSENENNLVTGTGDFIIQEVS